MKKLISLASALFATSIVSVSAAMSKAHAGMNASPASLTTSGQPASWKASEAQPNSAPVNPVAQPFEVTPAKPVDMRDKTEVKSIDAPVPNASTSTANRCVGDARFAKPPIVNNPHHLRNVIWRNMRSMCAN